MRSILLILLLIFAGNLYADNKVFLVNKTTGEVTDIADATPANIAIWDGIASKNANVEVKQGNVSDEVLAAESRKYDKGAVVIDTAKITADAYTQNIKEKVDAKQKILAIDSLLAVTEDAKEQAELTKQRDELEAKITALETAKETP